MKFRIEMDLLVSQSIEWRRFRKWILERRQQRKKLRNYYDFVYNESNRVYFEDIISLYENQNENEFGLYTVSHINKEESEEHIEEGNDSLGFIGLFNKTKNDDVDFDLDNDNINSNFNFLGTKRNSEEKLDELIQELKKENDEQQ